MAIRELGLQIRTDLAPHLRLEYDDSTKITIQSDGSGRGEITPDSGELSLVGNAAKAEFRVEPGAVDIDARIFGRPRGTGRFVLETNNGDVRIAAPDTTQGGAPVEVSARFSDGGMRLSEAGTALLQGAGDGIRVVGATAEPSVRLIPSAGGGAAKAFVIHSEPGSDITQLRMQMNGAAGQAQFRIVEVGTPTQTFNIWRFLDKPVRFDEPIRLDDGSENRPSLTFTSNLDVGWYLTGTEAAFSYDGTKRFAINANSVDVDAAVLKLTGATNQPGTHLFEYVVGSTIITSIGWENLFVDTFNFIMQDDAHRFAFVVGGVTQLIISKDQVTFGVLADFKRVAVDAGNVGQAAYTFDGDGNTGIYQPADGQVGITTDGVKRFQVSVDRAEFTVDVRAAKYEFVSGTDLVGSFRAASANIAQFDVESGKQIRFSIAGAVKIKVEDSLITMEERVFVPSGGTGGITWLANGDDRITRVGSTGDIGLAIFQSGTETVRFKSAIIDAKVPLGLPLGSAANPSLTFSLDPDTGIYRSGGNQLSVARNGAEALRIGATIRAFSSVQLVNGAVGTPALSFTNRNNTGFILVPGASAADAAIHYVVNGVDQGELQSGSGAHPDPILLGAGSAGAPTYSFTGRATTGMFSSAANILDFATGGAARLQLRNDQVRVLTRLRVVDGSAASPAIGFTSDPDTGMLLASPNTLAFATGGAIRLRVANTVITSAVRLQLPSDVAGATPSLTFGGPDTGIVGSDATINRIGLIVNGVVALNCSASTTPTQVDIPLRLTLPAGSAANPALKIGGTNSTDGLIETSGEIHYVKNGVDQGELATGGIIVTSGQETIPLIDSQKREIIFVNNSLIESGDILIPFANSGKFSCGVRTITNGLAEIAVFNTTNGLLQGNLFYIVIRPY